MDHIGSLVITLRVVNSDSRRVSGIKLADIACNRADAKRELRDWFIVQHWPEAMRHVIYATWICKQEVEFDL